MGAEPPIQREAVARLAEALPGTARTLGGIHDPRDWLRTAAQALAGLAAADACFIARAGSAGEAQALAITLDGRALPPRSYALSGSPCAEVLARQRCVRVEDAEAPLPPLSGLPALRGYLGVPAHDEHGAPDALVAVLFRAPLRDPPLPRTVLELFATRIGAVAARIERMPPGADPQALLRESRPQRVREAAGDAAAEPRELPGRPGRTRDLRLLMRRGRRAATVTRHIVEDLLDFATVIHHAPRPEDVDVVALFLDAVERLRPPTPLVVVEHPPACRVDADPESLAILMHQLVANALRSALGRAEIRLVLGVQPGCSFYVRDNGCGFAPARATEIFLPFPPGVEQQTGLGIGLATVARVVAQHGGRIWAAGEPDWGATFYVSLPPAV